MARALQATAFLTTVITAVALVLMVVGLVVSARPELSAGLGLTSKDGLTIALVCGAVAIVAAVLGRVLSLLRDNASD